MVEESEKLFPREREEDTILDRYSTACPLKAAMPTRSDLVSSEGSIHSNIIGNSHAIDPP